MSVDRVDWNMISVYSRRIARDHELRYVKHSYDVRTNEFVPSSMQPHASSRVAILNLEVTSFPPTPYSSISAWYLHSEMDPDAQAQAQAQVESKKLRKKEKNQQRRLRKQETKLNGSKVTASVDINTPSLPPPPPRDASQQEVFQAAFRESLNNGAFYDTKFFALSRRTTAGTVSCLRAVFANSLIMRATSSCFEQREWSFANLYVWVTGDWIVLMGPTESATSVIDAEDICDDNLSADSYDYWSDSDLEDEIVEVNVSENIAPHPSSQSADSEQTKSRSPLHPEPQDAASRSKFSAAEIETVRTS